jgi:hypothetical protein
MNVVDVIAIGLRAVQELSVMGILSFLLVVTVLVLLTMVYEAWGTQFRQPKSERRRRRK